MPEATTGQLLRVHTPGHLDRLRSLVPGRGYARVDPDTVISPGNLKAALHAAAAVGCRLFMGHRTDHKCGAEVRLGSNCLGSGGGYKINSLARCVELHIRGLMGLPQSGAFLHFQKFGL